MTFLGRADLHTSRETTAVAGATRGSDAAAAGLRGFTYQAVGQLASRAPALLAADASVAARFFAALATEPPGVRAALQEALSALAGAYAGCTGAAHPASIVENSLSWQCWQPERALLRAPLPRWLPSPWACAQRCRRRAARWWGAQVLLSLCTCCGCAGTASCCMAALLLGVLADG